MRNQLVSILVAAAVLCLNTAFAVGDSSPNQGDLKKAKAFFLEGRDLYEEGNFEEALEAFQSSLYEDPENFMLNHLIGQAAFKLEDFEEALFAFERALVIDPNHSISRLEKARTHLALGSKSEAKKELETVLKDPNLPEEVRTNVQRILAGAASDREHSFGIVVSASHTIDSNATLGTDQSLPSPFDPSLLSDPTAVHDQITALAVILSHAYPLAVKGLVWKNNGIVYMSDNEKLNTNDLALTTLSSGFAYGWKKHVLESYVAWTFLRIAGITSQNTVRLTLKHMWTLASAWQLLSQYQYTQRHHYLGPTATRSSGFASEGRGTLVYRMDDKNSFQGYGMIRFDKTPVAPSTENRYYRYETGASYNRLINDIFSANAGFFYRWDDYSTPHALPPFASRCDNGYTISLGANAKVNKKFLVGIRGEHTDNNSNIGINNYKSNRFTTTLTGIF